MHCPNEDPLTLANRVAIAAIRDQASAGLRRCSPETAGLLQEIARLATHAVFAPMPAGQVRCIARAITNSPENRVEEI